MSVKISALTTATTVTVDDLLQVVDVEDLTMAASGTNKKISARTLGNNLPVTATGSTTSRSLKDRFADTVNVKDFGAVGDGVTNDTSAIQAAIDSGKDIFLSTGNTYKITSNLTIITSQQKFICSAVLVFVGNCGVVIGGNSTGVIVDITTNSPNHTGYVVTVNTGHRSIIRLNAIDCYNAIKVTKTNVCTIDWLWASCRNAGILWYGTTGDRSDILNIKFALMSVGDYQYGLDWDGNCHSLQCSYLGIVCGNSVTTNNGYGVIIRNTSGGTAPAIGKFNIVEVDYCGTHAINITAGSDYDICCPYILGSSGSGIYIGAAINSDEVRILGGKSRGNARYGIEALGGVVLFGGSTDLNSNTLGETTNNVWTKSPRFTIDNQYYLTNANGNPLQSWDTNDYTTYDRANNVLASYINAAVKFEIGLNRVTFSVAPKLPSSIVSALPAIHLAGDLYFATNGRKNTEGAGSGTGIMVFSDGSAWRACDTGITVAS